ncbi:MAG: (2Fe-2S)-binding protein [Bryobacteraceae bacterium]|nr:(2Fe-2S)-binding protein [Bryobacteraceae bacterium]MDW8380353.1 (2Fe-2S)-binding protein [Bryobacterales bacterium]
MIEIRVNGKTLKVPEGVSVAAAIALSGHDRFRRSVAGQPRGPLCGIGVCFECRVTVDGEPHVRSCQLLCWPGMEVCTDD